mmetsp:Transcript_95685/g.274785  ORF Transcript_95685/g.274785 Transcript_95685/m.274785 type:complete len:233 (+) Transcript_95685:121-819(+)
MLGCSFSAGHALAKAHTGTDAQLLYATLANPSPSKGEQVRSGRLEPVHAFLHSRVHAFEDRGHRGAAIVHFPGGPEGALLRHLLRLDGGAAVLCDAGERAAAPGCRCGHHELLAWAPRACTASSAEGVPTVNFATRATGTATNGVATAVAFCRTNVRGGHPALQVSPTNALEVSLHRVGASTGPHMRAGGYRPNLGGPDLGQRQERHLVLLAGRPDERHGQRVDTRREHRTG